MWTWIGEQSIFWPILINFLFYHFMNKMLILNKYAHNVMNDINLHV